MRSWNLFYALLQKNVVDRQRWATRDESGLTISPGSGALPRPKTATPPRKAHPVECENAPRKDRSSGLARHTARLNRTGAVS
jgi:hypothetical protein